MILQKLLTDPWLFFFFSVNVFRKGAGDVIHALVMPIFFLLVTGSSDEFF